MRIYKKNVHLYVFLGKLIKYAPSFPSPAPTPPPQASSILNQASQPSRPGPGPGCWCSLGIELSIKLPFELGRGPIESSRGR